MTILSKRRVINFTNVDCFADFVVRLNYGDMSLGSFLGFVCKFPLVGKKDIHEMGKSQAVGGC